MLSIIGVNSTQAQEISINKKLLSGTWPSHWITCKNSHQREYGIYHFRKSFSLPIKPNSFIVHVTADNRYRLFVNGQPVCLGPARGDLFNWYFESIDIAPFLKPGNNVVAALVWNMGTLAPVAQISNQTGFVLQGNTNSESIINTDSTWKAIENKSYIPCSLDNGERLQAYMVVGPGDQVDASKFPWNWEQLDYDDRSWLAATTIANPVPQGYGTDNLWTLAPRNIPLMDEVLQRLIHVRRNENITITDKFLTGKNAVKIPANKTVHILLDQTENTVAYPELLVSKGKAANIKITYAESLFDAEGNKGNRNDITGKKIKGNYDIFLPDGGTRRLFRPLWFRAYRYIELEITTKEEPLILEDMYGIKTGYPLKINATFNCNDKSLKKIWTTGWRTAQLCAGEIYYDTPYYEQLQYTGDTRIQALISLYLSGDDRLMRKAIQDFYHSRTPEGLTQGRYPSNRLQIIPTFSLFWVSMIHDYWMHRRDDAFVEQFLPAISEILNWYEHQMSGEKQMLGPMKWWNFIDWDNFNGWGTAPGAETGNSAIISLQYAYTLNQAAGLFKAFGKEESIKYTELANKINENTNRLCFDDDKGLLADTPEKKSFSQHANIWAILSGAVMDKRAKYVMVHLLYDKSIGQATFFYKFYLTQALKKVGMSDQYYGQLGPWEEMLRMGLTTFAEKPEPTRSDCHAWSASPNYDFLSTICGINPSEPGFRKVLINPALGPLTEVKASMPHPDGMISVEFKRHGKYGLHAEIELPEALTGNFIWNKNMIELHAGKQVIDL